MSRTDFGFQKILWYFVRRGGLIRRSSKRLVHVHGEVPNDGVALKVGDVVGQSVWHISGTQTDTVTEQYRVTAVNEIGVRSWRGLPVRVTFERVT